MLPCADSPSEHNSDAALERLAQERELLSRHIADLTSTLEALDRVMTVARAHRETLLVATA